MGYIGIEKYGKWSKSKMRMSLHVQNVTVNLIQRQVQNTTSIQAIHQKCGKGDTDGVGKQGLIAPRGSTGPKCARC